jgi:hypothetical protein
MLFPSKFTSYESSIINKSIYILEFKDERRININLLYKKIEKKYANIDEYIFSLDLLFVLDYIELEGEDILYVN